MDVKWISREQAERVTSVWEPMSYPFNGDECEFDEQNIFITPSSSFFTLCAKWFICHKFRTCSHLYAGHNTRLEEQTTTPIRNNSVPVGHE